MSGRISKFLCCCSVHVLVDIHIQIFIWKCLIYGQKSHFMAPLMCRSKTKFPLHFPLHHFFIMPPKELREAYSNRTVRLSRFRVRSISPIFFEVGIPNLVCGSILGWRSVAYHFRVTVTLTSDLVFRIIVSGAYLLNYLR